MGSVPTYLGVQLPIHDVVVDHGLGLLSYGNANAGCGWCLSDTLHILMFMAAVWVGMCRPRHSE